MNVNMQYKINLWAKSNADMPTPDASYDVSFHMDNYGDTTDIEHVLESDGYHADLADADPEDIQAVEEGLSEWLVRRSFLGELTVKDDMTLDVVFEVIPGEDIKYAIKGG
jgi:hypothetical protein